jgi:hypothetical protein
MVRILFICLCVPFLSFGQLKGKMRHLPGVWVYKEGSGKEIWTAEKDYLVGAGYRFTKFGDSVKVEDLRIQQVNGVLTYTYTKVVQGKNKGKLVLISKGKKLDFLSTDPELPIHIVYKLSLNKKKLFIYFQPNPNTKKEKLTLHRRL